MVAPVQVGILARCLAARAPDSSADLAALAPDPSVGLAAPVLVRVLVLVQEGESLALADVETGTAVVVGNPAETDLADAGTGLADAGMGLADAGTAQVGVALVLAAAALVPGEQAAVDTEAAIPAWASGSLLAILSSFHCSHLPLNHSRCLLGSC